MVVKCRWAQREGQEEEEKVEEGERKREFKKQEIPIIAGMVARN